MKNESLTMCAPYHDRCTHTALNGMLLQDADTCMCAWNCCAGAGLLSQQNTRPVIGADEKRRKDSLLLQVNEHSFQNSGRFHLAES